MCSVSYTLCYMFAYVLCTCYLMGTKVVCMIVRAGGGGLAWVLGCSMCTCVCAQTLQHERQGRTLDYSPIEYQCLYHLCRLFKCYSMLCNCAEGLHFSAFHFTSTWALMACMPHLLNCNVCNLYSYVACKYSMKYKLFGGMFVFSSLDAIEVYEHKLISGIPP